MLSKSQQAVINCKDRKILCLAGAGSGKTHTLLARISKLVEDGVDPESILALTFTNAAAFEMQERYQSTHSGQKLPEFRTFHSFCYHLIAVDAKVLKAIGYATLPDISDDATEKRITNEAMLQTGLHLSDKKVYGNSVLTAEEARDLLIIRKAASRLMKQRNLITFNLLSKYVCDLFINDDPVVASYKQKYKYIHVDEYQDSDRLQDSFVKSFTDSYLFVVGDALQNLYSFRGTSSMMIKQLSKDDTWTTLLLKDSFRSTKQICKYANKFGRSYADPYYHVLLESTKDGPDVRTASYEASLCQGQLPQPVMKEIVDDAKQLPGTSAILARSNAEVKHIRHLLDEMHIAYDSSQVSTFSPNILKCVLDDEFAVSWLSSLLPSESYPIYVRKSVLNSGYDLHKFVQDFGRNKDINKNIMQLYKLRQICNEKQIITHLSAEILKVIGCKNIKINDCDIAKVAKNGNKLSDLLEVIYETVSTYRASASDLYVGTVHSVKGLEFDNVYVVGASGSSWKLNNEDNRNIFYVAVTRAKTNLSIYFAQ